MLYPSNVKKTKSLKQNNRRKTINALAYSHSIGKTRQKTKKDQKCFPSPKSLSCRCPHVRHHINKYGSKLRAALRAGVVGVGEGYPSSRRLGIKWCWPLCSSRLTSRENLSNKINDLGYNVNPPSHINKHESKLCTVLKAGVVGVGWELPILPSVG